VTRRLFCRRLSTDLAPRLYLSFLLGELLRHLPAILTGAN
jgi:hypothetical protein